MFNLRVEVPPFPICKNHAVEQGTGLFGVFFFKCSMAEAAAVGQGRIMLGSILGHIVPTDMFDPDVLVVIDTSACLFFLPRKDGEWGKS